MYDFPLPAKVQKGKGPKGKRQVRQLRMEAEARRRQQMGLVNPHFRKRDKSPNEETESRARKIERIMRFGGES